MINPTTIHNFRIKNNNFREEETKIITNDGEPRRVATKLNFD
jgi:hypothetical protein